MTLETMMSELHYTNNIVQAVLQKIRKDENYEKNYLVGKYGAIPVLKSIDILGVK